MNVNNCEQTWTFDNLKLWTYSWLEFPPGFGVHMTADGKTDIFSSQVLLNVLQKYKWVEWTDSHWQINTRSYNKTNDDQDQDQSV